MEIRIEEGEYRNVVSNDAELVIDGLACQADISRIDKHRFHVLIENKAYRIVVHEIDRVAKTARIGVNGKSVVVSGKDRYDTLLESLGMSSMAETKITSLKAPMPGLVIDVLVSPGVEVKKGESLIILEAMKMENVIKSPVDAVIGKVLVKASESVEKSDIMIEFSS